MKNITYTEKNGILYPDLALPEQPTERIGKYGQIRLDYLKTYRKAQYTTLLTQSVLSALVLPLMPRHAISSKKRPQSLPKSKA